jgi:signal transduction histidine kinase
VRADGAWAAAARHPRRVDAALAAFAALVAAPEALHDTGPPAWASYAACHLPLVWRRRSPVAACWAVLLLTIPAAATGVTVESAFPELVAGIAVYSAARHGPLPQLVPVCLAIVLPSAVAVAVDALASDAFAFSLALLAATVLLGLTVRTRQAYVGELEERAVRLERERDQQARIATAAERARIARDLHDVVAHNLAVMITLADGAAVAMRRRPDQAAEAVAGVATTGRQALAEMRRLLGVLQDDDDGTAPQPGLADVGSLVAQVRAAGLPVTLTESGTPGAWGPGAGLAVYRIVQEALTNTLKHTGPGVTAEVALRHAGDGIEVEVTDDGGHRDGPGSTGDGGRGLGGMAERAAAYGGELHAGPRADGPGWRVRARLRPEPAA